MPEARLPSGWKGWMVAFVASMIGFLAGFASIALLRQVVT